MSTSLNETPSGERVQIGIFGRTNAGKSSIFNQLIGQDAAVVSPTKGTTTDPVKKAMELLPIGPVVIIDTPGLDDTGDLGEKRIGKAKEILRRIDIALLIIDADLVKEGNCDLGLEKELVDEMKVRQVPFLLIINKAEHLTSSEQKRAIRFVVTEIAKPRSSSDALGEDADKMSAAPVIFYSTLEDDLSVVALRKTIASLYREEKHEKKLVADLVDAGDTVLLVIPIDESAPKGRLILPQQQVIRELLEAGAYSMVVRETELAGALRELKRPPKLVITDSQVFSYVADILPTDVELTSFSILQARYKGDLSVQMQGAHAIDHLMDGARILIAEGCTHHRQCKDIGTVKLPGWIEKHSNKTFSYEFTSGGEFPDNVEKFDWIVHCGGCMLNEKEMRYRITRAKEKNVPITNYGVLIAHLNGILERATRMF